MVSNKFIFGIAVGKIMTEERLPFRVGNFEVGNQGKVNKFDTSRLDEREPHILSRIHWYVLGHISMFIYKYMKTEYSFMNILSSLKTKGRSNEEKLVQIPKVTAHENEINSIFENTHDEGIRDLTASGDLLACDIHHKDITESNLDPKRRRSRRSSLKTKDDSLKSLKKSDEIPKKSS